MLNDVWRKQTATLPSLTVRRPPIVWSWQLCGLVTRPTYLSKVALRDQKNNKKNHQGTGSSLADITDGTVRLNVVQALHNDTSGCPNFCDCNTRSYDIGCRQTHPSLTGNGKSGCLTCRTRVALEKKPEKSLLQLLPRTRGPTERSRTEGKFIL